MLLDELPDLALRKICLNLEAKDIKSVQNTNRRLFNHVRANRLHYDKHKKHEMKISLTMDGQRKVEVTKKHRGRVRTTLTGEVDEVIKSINPKRLISYDHDELVNMSPLWWRERKKIHLNTIIDYRRYFPHFDRCTTILLNSENPMNLTEILASMNTKNLKSLSLIGNGEIQCTDEDFRRIGVLSFNMKFLSFQHIPRSSNISSDAILDMIEIGSFAKYANIKLPQIPKNMLKCLRRREWAVTFDRHSGDAIKIVKSDGLKLWIRKFAHDFDSSSDSDSRTRSSVRRRYRSYSYSASSSD